MAHEAINYDAAMKANKSFAKGNPFGANASRIQDNSKVNIAITGFTQNQLPSGETALYAIGSNAQNGSLRFRVQDPETDLPKMPIGSQVQVIKGSMPAEVTDRATNEVVRNEDGTPKMRTQHFVSFLQVVSTATAATAPATTVETNATVS